MCGGVWGGGGGRQISGKKCIHTEKVLKQLLSILIFQINAHTGHLSTQLYLKHVMFRCLYSYMYVQCDHNVKLQRPGPPRNTLICQNILKALFGQVLR